MVLSKLRELREISPNCTRAEYKSLLRRIKDVQAALQVTVWVRCACSRMQICYAGNLSARVHVFKLVNIFGVRLSSELNERHGVAAPLKCFVSG